jgi:hypothetical protein
MLTAVTWLLFQGIAVLGMATGAAPVERVDIRVPAAQGFAAQDCRLEGEVTLWVNRKVDVFDEMHEVLGSVEAGLGRFNSRARLRGCAPGGSSVDLSDEFVDFLVTDRQNGFGRRDAGQLAWRLALNSYQLAQPDGAPILLPRGPELDFGAHAHRFTIVLIRSRDSATYDAVIHRERVDPDRSPIGRALHRDPYVTTWSSVR